MAGGSLITKIKKAFDELVELGLGGSEAGAFLRRAGYGMLADFDGGESRQHDIEPQRPSTIARSLAIGNPADGHYAIKAITKSGGWAEDVSDLNWWKPFSCWRKPKAFSPRLPAA